MAFPPSIVIGDRPLEGELETPATPRSASSYALDKLLSEELSVAELASYSRAALIDKIVELFKAAASLQTQLKAANEALKGKLEDADRMRQQVDQRSREYETTIMTLATRLAVEEEKCQKLENKLKETSSSTGEESPKEAKERTSTDHGKEAEQIDPMESPTPKMDAALALAIQKRVPLKPRWSENVRTNRKLYIKISEAKELPKGQNMLKTGLVTERWEALSTYVVIQLDDKEIGRTDLLAKNYLWNQEFLFNVDNNFEQLTFTIWSKAKVKAVFRDGALAQLRLKRELLNKDQLKHEDWFPLYMAKKQKESLLGAIQLDINLISRPTEGLLTLSVRVINARNLGEKEDVESLYPYVALHILPDQDLKSTKQTQVQPESFNPVFNITFTFTLEKHQIADSKLHVSIWNSNVSKTERAAEHEFMGQILIPLAEVPISVLNSGDAVPDNSHFYALSGKSIPETPVGPSNLLQVGASRVLKKTNSVVLTLGKLTKAQVNLASLVRALSTLEPSDAVAHDYIPFKASENLDITDCDQCGGDLRSPRQPHKCKICGLVVHDCCRQVVTAECATAGSLRLSYRFYQETLLPYGAYNDLLSLVTEEPLLVLHYASTVCEVDRLQELAQTSLNIFHSQGSAVRFLNQLVTQEVATTKDPNTIFRGNSLATKCLDYFMKLIGRQYLISVLKKPIDEIFSEKKNCELDPTRAEATKRGSMDWVQNKKNLLNYLKKIVDSIMSSLEECPNPLREVFGHMQSEVAQRFPAEQNVRYIVVSGFIFLRFFCPALLGPKLFGLREDVPDQTIGRTLTMCAKVLQNLANIVDFGQKEPYLIDLNPFIADNKEKMKTFIDALSNNRESTLIRIGELEQRLNYEAKIYEGVENLHKISKGDKKQRTLVQKELAGVKDKVESMKGDLERLRKIHEHMPSNETPLNSEYDYTGKFNFDVESEMARLHSHLAAKRDATIALLESVDDPIYALTAKKFGLVLDQLDELLERLQRSSTAS